MGKQLFKSLMILGIFLTCGFATAQTTVTGTVSDADGPLPGVAVVVQGTDNGVTTDFDGNYSIVAAEGDILEYTFIGMTKATATVGPGGGVIHITLEGGENQLEEVVVVGYSTQTRGDITGSVASVDMAEALKVPVANASEALQGRVTGVTVTANAQPGAAPKIAIRGFGTANNTDPLFIIDGVQTTDPNILNSISPGDIEQMNVLKDAAAAIYGARASNGVIIVKTKSGGYGTSKATVTLDMWTGFAQAAKLPSNLNVQQHADMVWQSNANDGTTPDHPQYGSGAQPVIPTTLNAIPVTATVPANVNWAEEVTQQAPTSSIAMSVANSTDSGSYYMSVNYFTRDGIVKYTGFERANTMINSEFKIKDVVRIGEHMNVAFTNGNGGDADAMELANRMSPLMGPYDDDGNFLGPYSNSTGLSNTNNPLANLSRGQNDFNKSLRVFGDVYLEADLYDGLTFKTSYGISLQNFDSRRFQALNPEHAEPVATNTLFVQDQYSYEWTWSNTLMYNKDFGLHSINAVLGVEAVEGGGVGKEISRSGYLFEDPDFYNLSNGSGDPNVGYAYEFKNSLFSYFLSANYNYDGKYFATVTVRNDTSSRFQGDNKSQTFPSFSAGWLLSKENFYNSDAVVNRIKIKASYGQMGNQTIPGSNPTLNISTLDQQYGNYAINGSAISTGAILNSFGNADLKWETSVSSNLGIDLGFFGSKLTASLEFYKITTEDLIAQDFSLISTTAIDAAAPYVNLGSVENTGYDLSIGYNNTWDNGFTFGVLANFSQYNNEVTDLISAFQTGRSDLRGGAMTRTEVGRSISEFYGRNVIGLNDEGRFIYEDVNEDGQINDDDRKYIGSPHADFTYGVNFTFAYKGFDASLFFTGSQGNDIYNYQKIYSDFPTFPNGNRNTRVLNSWTPENTNTNLPALSNSIVNNETDPNSFFVEDGSYMRLKNLQIGYTFSNEIASKMAMESLRLYVVGTNLFTSTSYDGIDPEVVSYDNLTLGLDNAMYPASQIYTIGLTVKF